MTKVSFIRCGGYELTVYRLIAMLFLFQTFPNRIALPEGYFPAKNVARGEGSLIPDRRLRALICRLIMNFNGPEVFLPPAVIKHDSLTDFLALHRDVETILEFDVFFSSGKYFF